MNNPPVLGNISPIIPAGSDMEKAIEFYEQKLGFTTIYQEDEPVTMAIVKRDSAEIFLQQNDDTYLAEWTTFRIQVKHVEQLYEELQNKGRGMIHPNGQLQTKPWGMKEFAVIDPAGVCITFFEEI
ncbi:VOC family protein [Chroococcidiopsis sp. CCMEE 29]|uniref:bleomycin resistance protein n=1 Tax=Chroococcidiopsis sp. CCMEE 29 TaxID=155894 RepID=UPI002020AC7E|nr:VOC family protein [Chroococcidiopsis sp. CCMEE 29]